MFSGACVCMCCGALWCMCVYIVDVCAPDMCVYVFNGASGTCLLCGACMCKVYPIFGGVYDWWCMCGTCVCILYIQVYMMHNFTYIFGGAFDV